jgi:AcrR family transcriptional regulator
MDSPRERKRAAIVQAAFDVLIAGGVQALSFEAIARAAGMSRQLIRHYFNDLETLMTALCDHLADLYRNALIGGVAEIEDKNRLDFFLDFYFDLSSDHRKPRDDQAYDAVFAWAAGSDKVRANLRQQYGLLGQVVAHEIALQHKLGQEQCGELSYLFVCLMYGHWKMVATLGFAEEHKHITRQAMDRLIDSYAGQTREPVSEATPWASKG